MLSDAGKEGIGIPLGLERSRADREWEAITGTKFLKYLFEPYSWNVFQSPLCFLQYSLRSSLSDAQIRQDGAHHWSKYSSRRDLFSFPSSSSKSAPFLSPLSALLRFFHEAQDLYPISSHSLSDCILLSSFWRSTSGAVERKHCFR